MTAFHAHGQPVPGRTVAQREDLRREVVLIELTAFAHVPRTHRIVETTREYAHAVGRDVNAASAIRMALKLFD